MYCKPLQLGFLAHMELRNTGSNLVLNGMCAGIVSWTPTRQLTGGVNIY